MTRTETRDELLNALRADVEQLEAEITSGFYDAYAIAPLQRELTQVKALIHLLEAE